MNKHITLDNFLENTEFFVAEAEANKIFVYPTDTVYGIGALHTPENVQRIHDIKNRSVQKMFSIIAPDFEWILKNYATDKTISQLQEYLDRYHGVTYIFDYQHPGVRIIKHPFQKFVEKLGEAFITTSCNIAGEPTIDEVNKLPTDIADQVDYIIDGGVGGGKPSVLIDFVAGKVIER